ncbi:hypothetical protein [Shinella pollutisoli]|uniref:Uncharacterized protein n=1 Tax=Shinella pollutisoli TaxID=2250594 RepID=A0ABV7DGZ1_9HYPH|nr:hypothetical protein [Shinella pollutisoli]
MSTPRISWGLWAGRRAAAACGINGDDAEHFARALAPRIADIAREIMRTEQRRGPREIALFMLRNCTGRHQREVIIAITNDDIETAARKMLKWATEGLALAVNNPRPFFTPRPAMFVTVFHSNGARTRWQQIPNDPTDSDGHGRKGGAV